MNTWNRLRTIFGWCLAIANAAVLIFVAYLATQMTSPGRNVAIGLVIAALACTQYVAALVISPPPTDVRASILAGISGAFSAHPFSASFRPGLVNVSGACLYLASTILLNLDTKGMDTSFIAISRQIPVALQLVPLQELGIAGWLVETFGEAPLYVALVLAGIAMMCLVASLCGRIARIAFSIAVAIASRLFRWHWSRFARTAP